VIRRLIRALLPAVWLAVFLAGPAPAVGETAESRRVVALYDSRQTPSLRYSYLHQIVQLPLNHLGLVVVYHDLRRGLPDAATMARARGIITWFTDSIRIDPGAYINWLHRQLKAGRRLVVLQHPGVVPSSSSLPEIKRRFRRWVGAHHQLTYRARVTHLDAGLMNFEKPLPPVLPAFNAVKAVKTRTQVVLSVTLDGKRSDLIVLGSAGAYAAADYAILVAPNQKPPVRAWHINPFRFFRLAFNTAGLPKPDITTLSGRRILYSHIDGDGWRNRARQARFLKRRMNAAEVIYEEILLKYPDLPVTVGAVVGDLDPTWYGSQRQLDLARRIFRLPHVEVGHHTQSHPFAWAFFRRYRAEKERKYLARYPVRPGRSRAASVFDRPLAGAAPKGMSPAHGTHNFDRPRAYAVRAFSLRQEIAESTVYLKSLLPDGKQVALYQWSGDTAPFPAAVAATAKAGLRNLNGGDGRMYRNFRSYAFVAPYGRWVGRHWQPYASQSNEHIYTRAWKGGFFAYAYLLETINNTGRPIRIMPINVYYHLYLGERQEGLAALKKILNRVRRMEIAPVKTSRFAAMSDGFVRTRLLRLGHRRWRVEARDGIETIRFDRAAADCVDLARSHGVVGQRHHQGSLYVALDADVRRPVVALATCNAFAAEPASTRAYLVNARWRVRSLVRRDGEFRFTAAGFGAGAFVWRVPNSGQYLIRVTHRDGKQTVYRATVQADHRLAFVLPASRHELRVSISEAPR
jgi:hypothetical protein